MILTVQLFGGFRKFESSGVLRLDVAQGLSCEELKTEILQKLSLKNKSQDLQDLVTSSVLATEQSILSEGERIHQSVSLALLPPVCGG